MKIDTVGYSSKKEESQPHEPNQVFWPQAGLT